MKEYKWIRFEPVQGLAASKLKTNWFACRNKETCHLIGQVKWAGNWRCYAFFPEAGTLFETQCLKDITDFLEGLMLERKLQKQNEATKSH